MSNWWNLLIGSAKSRELDDTRALYQKAHAVQQASPFANEESRHRFLIELIHEICERRGITPTLPLGRMLYDVIGRLALLEGFSITLPEFPTLEKLTIEEGMRLRTTLNQNIRFVDDYTRLLPIWRDKLVWAFSGALGYFPPSAFTDIDEDGHAEDDSVVFPEATAYDLCDNLPSVVERLIMTFFDDDVCDAHLFDTLRERLDVNALVASGISPERRDERSAKLILPTKCGKKSPEELVQLYLRSTPLQRFFEGTLPFAIPFPARFEHTHIVGGSGHGKTQLMQFLINHDLERARDDGRSVVVLDSQGDLIKTISRLKYFRSGIDRSLADRFVLVDPNDVEHPVCLNMFDFNRDRLSGYAPVDREKILNATIELYEYFFGALLGAELTQRQGLIFRYLARLLIEIPDATIHTLRELMEDGERFRPYMEKLSGTARSFFATQFFDRKFGETKKQILTRLWGVLSNQSLERMFSHTTNKIDIFELLNQGKIVLINTAKDLLGQEGAAIFGRFFIALIAQAAIQRAALPPHERRPSFVYIDEAQDYFDENISHLLNQARKFRVGLIFAHQNLDQLGAGLRSSVLASTTIKFAGGVSAKDANTLDSEFRCDAAFLMGQVKGPDSTEFACHVRNFTGTALSVRIPLGYVESLPKMRAHEWEELLEENRERYSGEPMIPEDVQFQDWATPRPTARRPPERVAPVSDESLDFSIAPPEPSLLREPTLSRAVSDAASMRKVQKSPPAPQTPGRGGQRHKYLQHLLKELAEDRGFRASIEETILDGAGRVDVAITRGAERIAFEISVTTSKDHELGNIEKCLAAGFTEVVLVASTERHGKSLHKFIQESIDEKHHDRLRYVTPESLVEYLDSLGASPVTTEQVVRGYKVRTVQKSIGSAEADTRRKAIAEVIARSLKKEVN